MMRIPRFEKMNTKPYTMYYRLNIFFTLLLVMLVGACGGPDLPEEVAREYEALPPTLDFNQDIKPILSDKCYLCHGPDKGKIEAGLQLHEADLAYSELPESPANTPLCPVS